MSTRGSRSVIVGAALVLALAACGGSDSSTDLGASPRTTSMASSAPPTIPLITECTKLPRADIVVKVHSDDYYHFTPSKLKLPAGEEVTVVLINDGEGAHDFTLEPLACGTGRTIDTQAVTFVAPTKRMTFVCLIHKLVPMKGRIVPI